MIEEWQRLFPDVDVQRQLQPVYPFNDPRASIILYDGLVGGIATSERPGTVELAFSNKPSIRWNVDRDSHDFSMSTGSVDLRLRRGERDWTVTAHGSIGGGWFNRAEFVASDQQLQRVIVHWINLPNILAHGRIATDESGNGHCWLGRWETTVGGWHVTLDRRHDYDSVMVDTETAPLFVLTHVMEVRQADGGSFDVASARQLLECLRVCFSFAFGRWVAPALPVGYGAAGQVVWEEWTSPICYPAQTIGAAWLYPLRPDDLAELVKHSLPAFLDQTRPGITRFQMISAVQSVETGFVEQRIMVAFPALENLAWATLVLGCRVPKREYKNKRKWPGERRLRRLLELAHVPIDIDAATLPTLAGFAATKKLDGPAAVTTIRNMLIHPASPQDQIYHLDGLVLDAWLLSRHYLTLLVLHSIGYQGSYVKLVPPYGWAGDAKPVPWTATNQ